MRGPLLAVLGAGLLLAGGAWLAGRHCSARHARELARQQEAWAAEKAGLEAAIEQARAEAARVDMRAAAATAPPVSARRLSPAEIIERLRSLGASGAVSAARLREAVYWLEDLARIGPAALPAVREFLARNEEIEFDTSWFQGRAGRDWKWPAEQVAPVSLRLGLFDVVRRIGGEGAEALLVETLGVTGRGLEVAWLTRALHEMATNKYREAALTSARALLASGAPQNSASPLDRYHREYLFGVLAFYGDSGYAAEAQAQLVRADSQIDRGALKYLQQTLGPQAVPIVAQAYQNPALGTNSSAKEPLARLALNYVGADGTADEFWRRAINDPVLTQDQRRNLIEDLNQDGFADTRNLTANDLSLIQARMALIEELAPNAMDKVNAAAFAEAYKDLVNMRAKIAGQAPTARP